ncbi:hypothetical protein HDU98_002010 [Podochytrium sp. JEL0797]|nr:hypothetical protein HDU98_002010 [Podochytrium sp. JEL0797]
MSETRHQNQTTSASVSRSSSKNSHHHDNVLASALSRSSSKNSHHRERDSHGFPETFDSSLLASELKKQGSNDQISNVSTWLKNTGLSTGVGAASTKTAAPLSPKCLLEKLSNQPAEILLLDVRSLQDFHYIRIKSSANIILPSLIMKRIKKGGISSFLLENFLTNEASKLVFQEWKSLLGTQGCSIVVYDEDINDVEDPDSDSYTLIKAVLGCQLVSSHPNLAVYFLNGGLNAFCQEAEAAPFIDGVQLPKLQQHAPSVNTGKLPAIDSTGTTPTSSASTYATPSMFISAASPTSTVFTTPTLQTPTTSPGKAGTPLLTTPGGTAKKRPSFGIAITPTNTSLAGGSLSASMEEEGTPAISALAHVSTVAEYILLGSEVVPAAVDAVSQLKGMGVTHVLNMAKEVRDEALMVGGTGIEFKWVGVYDHPDEEIDGPIREGVAFIKQARGNKANAKVLVHCKAGRSRSVAVVIAYLIMEEKMTLRDAYELVRRKRNGIIPNIGFMLALLHIELEVLGCNTEVNGSNI